MGCQTQREALKRINPNRKWSRKINQMTDEQVVEIYMRLKLQNKV